jgi:predicted nucleic acid-binding protein
VTYFDSAYVAKFYLDEPESEGVRRLAEELAEVGCAVIGQAEVAAVFHRKLREAAFTPGVFREVLAQFTDDCENGLWTWLPMTPAIAAKTTAAFAGLPRTVFLRGADALHLVSAREHGAVDVYTNDRHMAVAARYFSLRVRSVDARRS